MNDTLKILHPGYNEWMSFKVDRLSKDTLFVRDNDTRSLFTKHLLSTSKLIDLDKLEIIIVDSRFLIAKKMTVSSLDSLVVEDLTGLGEARSKSYFKLPSGYFAYLKILLSKEGAKDAKRENYQPEGNDGRAMSLLLMRKDRIVKKILIRGIPSDSLTRVLIPIIYCEDLLHFSLNWLGIDFTKYPTLILK